MWKQDRWRVSAATQALRSALAVLLLTLFGWHCGPLSAAPQAGGWQQPAQLDDAGWASLKDAMRGSMGAQQARLTGEVSGAGADGADLDAFGTAIALYGDTALVGVPLDQVAGGRSGSVYVFVRSGAGLWTQQAKLVVANVASVERFGTAVALEGDTAAVGATLARADGGTRTGAAYVYTRKGSTWTQQARLLAADGADSDRFGSAVALHGDTLLVGASNADRILGQNQGAAYVFTRLGTNWTQQAKLEADDGTPGDTLGTTVALFGDTALVAASRHDVGTVVDQGAAYVFLRNGASWTQQAQLLAPAGLPMDLFGTGVALYGDTALVGSQGADVTQLNQGAAHVFIRTGVTWTHEALLVATDAAQSDSFGVSVALHGDTALIGTPFEPAGGDMLVGSAYVFQRSGASWTEQQKLQKPGGAMSDLFGFAVAVHGDTLLVGVHNDDLAPLVDVGSVRVYTHAGSTWTQQALLSQGTGVGGNQLGFRVALSGDTAVVGAYLDDVGSNPDQGSVYVYVRSDTSWTQQAQLFAADGAANDQFGWAVAVDGDTLLVGAYLRDIEGRDDQGAVYVFSRSGTSWSQQAQLVAADGEREDYFGHSVALSGDTALIGVVLDDVNGRSNQGSARVYTRSGTSWTQQAVLTAADGAVDDIFGFAVALSGDTSLVSAPLDDIADNLDQGAAYVYTRAGSIWTQQARLQAADGTQLDEFGRALDLLGGTAIVGVPKDNDQFTDRGSAYVYAGAGSNWIQQAKLMSMDGAQGDQFGFAVALSGDAAMVGEPFDNVGNQIDQGSVHIYTRSAGTWTQQLELHADDGLSPHRFGSGVAFSGNTALVGAPGFYTSPPYGNPDEGAAYVYGGVDLAVALTDFVTQVSPGGLVEYRIDVGNIGPLAVIGSRLQAPATAGLSEVLWACTPLQPAVCPTAAGSGGIDQLLDLPVNGGLRYVLSAQVDATVGNGSTITQTASIDAPAGSIESQVADNMASDVDTVVVDAVFANGFEN
jgi:hypothetical protein